MAQVQLGKRYTTIRPLSVASRSSVLGMGCGSTFDTAFSVIFVIPIDAYTSIALKDREIGAAHTECWMGSMMPSLLSLFSSSLTFSCKDGALVVLCKIWV